MINSRIWKLFKLQIDEVFNFFKIRDVKKVLIAIFKYALIVSALYLAVNLMIRKVTSYGFIINIELISIVVLVIQCILVIFFTGNIVKKLFLSKNNEVLLSLPVTSNQIFISKMLVIYIYEIVFTSVFLIPMLLTLHKYASFGSHFYIMLPLFILIFPLGPLAFGAFIAIPVYKIYQYLKEKVIISSVLILGFIAVGLFFYTRALGDLSKFDLAGGQIDTVVRVNNRILEMGTKNVFFLQVSKAMFFSSNFYWSIIYLGISILLLMMAVLIIKPFFVKITMQVYEKNVIPKRVKAFKKRTPLYCLIKKEALTTIRTPGCIFQYFVFAFLMPIFAILYNHLLLSMDIVTEVGKTMIAGTHLLVVAMLAMLSNVFSATAISREGRSFGTIKMIPVDYFTQTAAKVIFNTMVTWSAVILTGIAVVLAGNFLPHTINIWVIIATTVIVLLVSLGHLCLSYDMDLKKPALSWYDEGNIEKVSGNTTKSILWAIGLSIGLCILVTMLALTKMKVIPWLIIILLSLIFCVYFVYRLILRSSYQYEELEV